MKSSQPQAPAVVKKSSPNGKLTIYLGKRDFISYKDYSENIDGILLIDPNYLDRIKKTQNHDFAELQPAVWSRG